MANDDGKVLDDEEVAATELGGTGVIPTTNNKLTRVLNNFHIFYNPTLPAVEADLDEEVNKDAVDDLALLSATKGGKLEPDTLKEAWHNENTNSRKKRRDAVRKEFKDMLKKHVWQC
jgi:hypothetical protein